MRKLSILALLISSLAIAFLGHRPVIAQEETCVYFEEGSVLCFSIPSGWQVSNNENSITLTRGGFPSDDITPVKSRAARITIMNPKVNSFVTADDSAELKLGYAWGTQRAGLLMLGIEILAWRRGDVPMPDGSDGLVGFISNTNSDIYIITGGEGVTIFTLTVSPGQGDLWMPDVYEIVASTLN